MTINTAFNKGVSYLNTILLGVVIFFLLRLVNQFDAVVENVSSLQKDIAIVKYKVDRHEQQLESNYNLKIK